MKKQIYASMDDNENPPNIGWAVVDINEELVTSLRVLSAAVDSTVADQIRKFDDQPVYEWSGDDREDTETMGPLVQTEYMVLCVSRTEFWWEGWPKESEDRFSTACLNITDYTGEES